jgi:hypothetical protein
VIRFIREYFLKRKIKKSIISIVNRKIDKLTEEVIEDSFLDEEKVIKLSYYLNLKEKL